jgi:predicted RNA binding protein YcfA (HicA-like mRNA interferase family)
MSLPRDLSGERLAKLLKLYGYEITRQTGSHMRLTSRLKGRQHHITIPTHKNIRVGTLHSVLSDVAIYLERNLKSVQDELFS